MRNESRNVKGNIPEKQEGESRSVISRQNLIEEQSNDKELLDLFKKALTPLEAEKVSVGYINKDNILHFYYYWKRNGLMRTLRKLVS